MLVAKFFIGKSVPFVGGPATLLASQPVVASLHPMNMLDLWTMDYRKQDNGLFTFLEHWNILIVAVSALIAFEVLEFFRRLSGAPWLWFFFAAFAVMISGG